MVETSLVEVRAVGRACVLTLRREEKLNALSQALERELKEALDAAAVVESACVIITGTSRAFSAGADIDELRDRDPSAIAAYYRETGDVYERVAALTQPQPVPAASTRRSSRCRSATSTAKTFCCAARTCR